jgi:O-methyltransferase
MKVNLVKLISPDFFLGKLLITIKSIFSIIWMLIKSPSQRSLRLACYILQIKPKYTMVTNPNLVGLYTLVNQANRQGLPGDIVECGVWNGGSAALMGAACFYDEPRKPRTIWLFDSFQGLPEPEEKDGDKAQNGYFTGYCKGDQPKVRDAFRKLGLSEDIYEITPGWFDETLQHAPIEEIALLHIDADWYDSVLTVLDAFYDKVVSGGMVVFDDYGYWEGCQQAVQEFINSRRINPTLQTISKTGVYFVKQ